jgi:cation:H+ antiporter
MDAVLWFAGLSMMLLGCILFTNGIELLGHRLKMHQSAVGSIVAAIGTALPEKLNWILWARRSKDTFALGNMTGAMVFQSCFPVVFGMTFRRWDLPGPTMISALIALGMAQFILGWVKIRRSLSPWPLLAGGRTCGAFVVCALRR